MNNNGLQIVEYKDNPSSREELLCYYKKAYPEQPYFLDGERLVWHVVDSDARLSLMKEDDGEIVGQVLSLSDRCRINGQIRSCWVATNLIVDKSLRGKGAGRKLMDQSENTGRLTDVGWCTGSNEPALRLHKSRGWAQLPEPRLHSLFFNPKRCLRYVGVTGWKSFFASPVLKVISMIERSVSIPPLHSEGGALRVSQRERVPGLSLTSPDRFFEEQDHRWESMLSRYGFYSVRTAESLNYKYTLKPNSDHSIQMFWQKGHAVGYLVTRTSTDPKSGIRLGRIVDMVYDATIPKLAEEMVAVAVKMFRDKGNLDGVVGVASTKDLKRAFRRNGMILNRQMIVSVRENGFTEKNLREQYREPVYLTLGDADLDAYW